MSDEINIRLTVESPSGVKVKVTSPKYSPHIATPDDTNRKIETLWNTVRAMQETSLAISTRREHPTVEIDTDQPIAIGFLADAHIGAATCKYEDLEQRFEAMVKVPNFYLVSVGDTIDNYLPAWNAQGMFGQIVPPDFQKQMVEHLYKRMKGRWLAAVQGCHDEASHKTDDFDWTKYLAHQLGCHNLGHGGFLDVRVGKTGYRLGLRHKYRFNSSANLTHTVKRMREQLGDFDIGCIAHHHQAAVEQCLCGDGVDRIFIRPGSFKGSDRYARSLGYRDTGAFIPSVVLFPGERRMIPFLHLDQTVAVMKALNAL